MFPKSVPSNWKRSGALQRRSCYENPRSREGVPGLLVLAIVGVVQHVLREMKGLEFHVPLVPMSTNLFLALASERVVLRCVADPTASYFR